MTPQRAKELLPIIQAFAEGKEVQVRDKGCGVWVDASTRVWDGSFEYRIKPAPLLEPWTLKNAPRVFAVRHKETGHYTLIDHGKNWHTGDVIEWDFLAREFDRVMEDGTTAPCGILETP